MSDYNPRSGPSLAFCRLKSDRAEAVCMPGRTTSRDEATKLLRTVAPERAFYFYKGIGEPLGSASKNLAEFADSVRSIDPTSVKFHLERGDFESWFKLLGDQSLASQVASIRRKNASPIEARTKISSIVSLRVSQLQKIAESDKR